MKTVANAGVGEVVEAGEGVFMVLWNEGSTNGRRTAIQQVEPRMSFKPTVCLWGMVGKWPQPPYGLCNAARGRSMGKVVLHTLFEPNVQKCNKRRRTRRSGRPPSRYSPTTSSPNSHARPPGQGGGECRVRPENSPVYPPSQRPNSPGDARYAREPPVTGKCHQHRGGGGRETHHAASGRHPHRGGGR